MPPGPLARGWTSYERIPLLFSLSWKDSSSNSSSGGNSSRTDSQQSQSSPRSLSDSPTATSSFSLLPSTSSSRTGWRPRTLKPTAHILFAAMTVGFIVGLEVVLNVSRRNGSITFLSSKIVDMAFDYVPLLLAVVYGLIWAAIDHDVKRFEPYFQMSKPGGVTAEHSLLLEYPYTFAAIAPFIAFKKRHWEVLCSALMLVMIMYGVTPLMSAAITKMEVTKSVHVPVHYDVLLPVESQRGNVSAAFAYLAYAHQYLGGSLPGFTTENEAVLPVVPGESYSTTSAVEDIWIVESTVYEGMLNCTPGIIERVPGKLVNETRVSTVDRSCEFMLAGWGTHEGVERFTPYTSFFMDGKNAVGNKVGAVTYAANCTMENFFVAGWARNRVPDSEAVQEVLVRPDYTRAEAIFCHPVHSQYEAQIRLKAESRQIVPGGIRQMRDKIPFHGLEMDYWMSLLAGNNISATTEAFNVSDSLAQLPDHLSRMRRNPAFRTLVELYPNTTVTDAGNYSYSPLPINVFQPNPKSLMGFGLTTQTDLEDLFNTTNLIAMYDTAYRKLFAFAVISELARPATNGDGRRFVDEQTRVRGYVAEAAWFRALEAALGIILVLNVVLGKLVYHRKFNLAGEPGTLSAALACVDSPVLEVFRDSEFMRPKRLETELEERGLRYELRDQKVSIAAGSEGDAEAREHVDLDRSRVTLTKPWELALALGCISMALLIFGLAFLCVVYVNNRSNYPLGFRESANGFGYSLYSSYVPTIAVTILESYLVLLGAQVALLYPFKQLHHGGATHVKSLSVNYDRAPPHLQLPNAFKAHNLLLGGVSLSILLANILAVAVGGVFDKQVVRYDQGYNVSTRGGVETLDNFNASSLAISDFDVDPEPFYAVFAGTLGSQPPRPWTYNNSFFIPFTDNNPTKHEDSYWVESVGLGVDIECRPLDEDLTQDWHGYLGPPNNYTYEILTLREKNDTSLVLTGPDTPWDEIRHNQNNSDGLVDHSPLFSEAFFTNISTFPEGYVHLPPTPYPRGLNSSNGTMEFFTSWLKYKVEPRNVTVDRLLGFNAPRSILGQTISGPSAYIASKSIIYCNPQPLIVHGLVQSGISGNISEARNLTRTTLPTAGLTGLLQSFNSMMLRIATQYNTPAELAHLSRTFWPQNALSDPRPSDWMGMLVARASTTGFDPYADAAANAKALSEVYKTLFATYLQLNSDAIFAGAIPAVVPATRQRHETRVVMRPVAFFIAVGILVLIIFPAIVWTYVALYRAFLCHAPTNLAGIYAAVYASRARMDVQGTERMKPILRARTLELLGYKYRYGWFLAKDGDRHFGVEREALYMFKPRAVSAGREKGEKGGKARSKSGSS
ncbi:hypothetical protein BZA05DRAFT_208676 [Tricharina praecox]|uniref:uncharacterized protein n=1 Tax=Tricharina praecox TaxID=43433 RepID=UPI002220A8D6|nr:uncharacterized protein BZA05DRAFT_208676 [Tricharina praecox]KAI5842035.1 hypothetical protein BZA05DRAFT_208676 [Tricharina praecox]